MADVDDGTQNLERTLSRKMFYKMMIISGKMLYNRKSSQVGEAASNPNKRWAEEKNTDGADKQQQRQHNDGHASFEVYAAPELKLNVAFEDLKLTINSRGKAITILNSVSGTIPAGSSVAIMGQSHTHTHTHTHQLFIRHMYSHTTITHISLQKVPVCHYMLINIC